MIGREECKYDIKKMWNSFFVISRQMGILLISLISLPEIIYCPVFKYQTLELCISAIFQNIK